MMLEVPAAAVMIDDLLELVDFVSVGSNDLVQYLTAADRDNPKVSHLCQASQPRRAQSVTERDSGMLQSEQTGFRLRRNGGFPTRIPAVARYGVTKLQHEFVVHSRDS